MAGSLREPRAAPAGDHVAATSLPLTAVTRVTLVPAVRGRAGAVPAVAELMCREAAPGAGVVRACKGRGWFLVEF